MPLTVYQNKRVHVVTTDGRILTGILKGFDSLVNMVLDEANERVYSIQGMEVMDLGSFILI